MASTALSGDRRWASGRRGGMTVLGKVTVPKPINLPSQRLENQGLDPNVEIVPKGTLSWGSRTSATSNAWGSRTLSPKTDGCTLSPSNLSAHPSSGENGTRPSTADSDKAYEPSTIAWGTNSRPSSASGAHTSSQTLSVLLRPGSAETRTGSSQLSRFAEPLTENSVAGVVERMGMTSSRNDDGFSLSSGDFPVLGSDKNGSGKSTVSQEHPFQGSGSPSVAIIRESEGDSTSENEVKHGVLNSWRREDTAFGEVRPGIDKWQGKSPPFPNSGMRPQHINAWRGPMVDNYPPGSSWYGGSPGGSYGGPVAPGGFPIEPFPYYHPQAAPPVLPNPQPAPPSGARARGHRPNSEDLYRPPIPDAFVRPNIPIGPGFYPGPLPYDGYFGPPLRYRSPNEQDITFVGFPPGVPSPYCRYPAPENGCSNAGHTGFGDKLLGSEKAELDCSQENSAQYKVLLKQHDSWDDEEEHRRQGESKAISTLSLNLGAQCKRVSPENDRKLECIENVERNSEIGDPKCYPKSDERVGASIPWRVNSPDCLPVQPYDVDPAGRSKKHAAAEVSQSLSATTEDFSLIQKIESLNAKARASDNQRETSPVSDRPEQAVNVQIPLLSHSTTEIKSEAQFIKKNQETRNTKAEWSDQVFSTGGKSRERSAVDGAIFSRPYPYGGQGRGRHHGERFGMQENIEQHNNPVGVDSSMQSMETSNIFPNTEAGDHLVSQPSKNEGGSKPVAVDSSDSLAERARLKELAKQRVRQLQEEEEERARDQKARALTKLEELNKRRQLEESSNSKTENISTSGTDNKGEQRQRSLPLLERHNTSATSVVSICSLRFEASSVSHSEKHSSGVDGSATSSKEAVSRSSQTSYLSRDAKSAEVADHIPGKRLYNHNLVASKEKPNMLLEKTFFGEPPKVDSQTAVVAKSSESVSDEITLSAEKFHPSSSHNVVETTVHQRRKGSKTSRTKHKVGDLSPVSISTVEEASRVSTSEENRTSKSLKPDMDSSFIQPSQDSEDLKQSLVQPLSVSTETAWARVNFLGSTQPPRRTPRNQQVSKQSEKSHGSEAVTWAPRSQNKPEVAVETNDEMPIELANLSLKNDVSQKNPKHKRDEMERYVPKPVVKEMAQQRNISQVATRNNRSTLTEGTALSVNSASHSLIENDQSLKPTPGKETRNLDSRTNKPVGAIGLWRQRGPKELTTEGESHPTELGKDDQNMTEDLLAKDSEMRYFQEKQKSEASGDRPNPSVDSDSTGHVCQPTRDQRPAARVKHHNYRVTGTGMDIKLKKGSEFSGKPYNQCSVSDQRAPAYGVVDRLALHWQPKAPKLSPDNPQGSRPGGKLVEIGDTRVDVEEAPKTEAVPITLSEEKLPSDASTTDYNAKLGTGTDHSNEGAHPEINKRERRVAQSRGSSRQNESGLSAVEELQQNEPEMHPGSSKNQNGHHVKGYDSLAGWRSRGRHGKQQQNPSLNLERQRANSHYRYQPVGMGDNNKMEYVDGSRDASSQEDRGRKNAGPGDASI